MAQPLPIHAPGLVQSTMSLEPGTKLGPYEVLSALGAGGMGEVYRARDSRLGRDVALKILPDPTHHDRFEQEARAVAALNHPNIMAVFDVGENYFVSELVEGDSLRNLPAMPLRKVLEIAAQIADGLAAAHAAGIVHRDLKPENIMVTRDGRAKILDFGLAKVQTPALDPDLTRSMAKTEPGMVMGTAGYMSPEQVQGHPADARSDIFSFGLVLYEMLSGERAFKGDSAVAMMSAILMADPPALPPSVPQGIAQIVNHCIEKNPAERFQSARDLAFALRAFGTQTHSGSEQIKAVPEKPAKRGRRIALIVLGVIVAIAAVFIARYSRSAPEMPKYMRLTFNRGFVSGARFAPDGKTIVYSAAWDGDPFEIFSTRVDSTADSRSLSISNAHVFAISSDGEVAVGLEPKMAVPPQGLSATLARVPLAGGAPRPVLENVYAADYQPQTNQLAIARMVDGAIRVEFPPGKVIYQTTGWISVLRFSRDGKRLAIADHPLRWDDRGDVAVLDLEGHKKVLSGGWEAIEGLAWSAAGDEVWFAGAKQGYPRSIYGVNLNGRQRAILNSPSSIFLRDIGADGRVLIANDGGTRNEMTALAAGDARERHLAYLDQSVPIDLSADGKTVLFTEGSAGHNYGVCLRKTDGSPVIALSEGAATSLSADGRWALAILLNRPMELLAVPTGAGETVHVPKIGLDYGAAQWMPDSKRILFRADAPGKASRLYLQSIFPLGDPRPITGDQISMPAHAVSPDGKFVVARHAGDPLALYPIDGGEPMKIAGLHPEDDFARWDSDANTLYFFAGSGPRVRIYKLNWRTGATQNIRELMPSDTAGVFGFQSIQLTPDASTLVYGFGRLLVNLQIVDGLQ